MAAGLVPGEGLLDLVQRVPVPALPVQHAAQSEVDESLVGVVAELPVRLECVLEVCLGLVVLSEQPVDPAEPPVRVALGGRVTQAPGGLQRDPLEGGGIAKVAAIEERGHRPDQLPGVPIQAGVDGEREPRP